MIYISKSITDANGLVLSHHKVCKVELSDQGGALMVSLQSWANESSRIEGYTPASSTHLRIPLELLGSSSNLVSDLSLAITVAGPFSGGQVVSDSTGTVENARARKNAEINAERLKANRSTFTFAGKQIACDELSRGDIDGINGDVSLTGNLPPGWPGAWKAVDNSYVAIPDLETWKGFYRAMVTQGMTNFAHAQALKALVDSATTVEEVNAIYWGMSLPE